MGYSNVYFPIQNLQRTNINVFGLSWILFFRHSDVQSWPGLDPVSGVINTALVFQPGSGFYSAQFIEKDRQFKEAQKSTQAGPYVESTVGGAIGGNNLNHIVAMAAMMGESFGVLIQERNGEQRLLGNEDAGCSFIWDYQSGEVSESRKRNCQWTFESPYPVPIYQGGSIIIDNQIIPVGTPSGGTITPSSSFALLTRFVVGPTAIMHNGDTIFTSPDLADKKVIVMADGVKIPELPTGAPAQPNKRTVLKVVNETQLTINGGVVQDEIIEIFIYS